MIKVIDSKLIESGMSESGGWNAKQLSVIGVSWPPAKGWKLSVIGKEILKEDAEMFFKLKTKGV